MSDEIKRGDVLRRLGEIAMGRCNDAVKLTFMDPDALGLSAIDGMDLTMVSEFKRSANGAVEVKFHNRLEALSLLLEQAEGQGLRPEAMSFLNALNSAGEVTDHADH